jgi:hypothetical protein
LRKFSISNINNFDVLKNAVIGFEFEFYADKSYYKFLEYLNNELGDIEVKGYKIYHSKFKPTDKIFKLEADWSLGPRGCELITGPLPYVNAKIILLKILKMIQDFGRTNEKCSLHINISFDQDESGKNVELLNRLKMILDVDENYIYRLFPERQDNFYAKSVKKLIPYKNYDFANNAINHIINNLELPNTKYYGINTQTLNEGRLEIRYIGGFDYENKTSEIIDLMDYFIILANNCIDEPLSKQNVHELREYLNKNISNYKTFRNLEDFIAEFPTIKLQVDKETEEKIMRVYFDKFYNRLFDVINNIYNLQDCIINFNTETNKLELVDAEFKGIFDIKNIDLIQCTVEGGTYSKCNLVNSELKNCHVYTSNIMNSDIFNTKVEASKVDSTSQIINCYLFNTLLDGDMNGGVFRSGKIGPYANIGDDVEIITGVDSYFGVKQQDTGKDKKLVKDKKKWMKGDE